MTYYGGSYTPFLWECNIIFYTRDIVLQRKIVTNFARTHVLHEKVKGGGLTKYFVDENNPSKEVAREMTTS